MGSIRNILLVLIFVPQTIQAQFDRPIIQAAQELIESFELDVASQSQYTQYQIKDFIGHEHEFITRLNSKDPDDLYISAIMLGLLKNKEALPALLKAQEQSLNGKIAISFSLCMLEYDYEKNFNFLITIGKEYHMVGSARSLEHLIVVELLPFLNDSRFLKFANELKTDETFQMEIISHAKKRFQLLKIE